MPVTWNGDEYLRKVEDETARRLEMAAIHLVNEVRVMISIPSRTVTHGTYTKGSRKGQSKTILGPRGSARSKPGEPPRKDFGTLRSSIAWEINKQELVARVGTSVNYAKFLELGTAALKARPFLRRALAENREEIRQIVEFGGRSDIDVS